MRLIDFKIKNFTYDYHNIYLIIKYYSYISLSQLKK